MAGRSRTPPSRTRVLAAETPPRPTRPSIAGDNLRQRFAVYIESANHLAKRLKDVLEAHGIRMLNRYGDDMFVDFLREELLSVRAPELLFVGINPSMHARIPWDPATASGSLLEGFLQHLRERRIAVLLWNIGAGISLVRDGSDFPLDKAMAMIEDPCFIALHKLNVSFIDSIVEYRQSIKHVWALGRMVLASLRGQLSSRQVHLRGSPHPSHALRLSPPVPDGWLRCMISSLEELYPSGANHISQEIDDCPHDALWFEPLVINFLVSHRIGLKLMGSLLTLPPELQAAIVLQGSLDFAGDQRAVLAARIDKAKLSHLPSVCLLVNVRPDAHIIQQFMFRLNAEQQQRVMSTSLDGARDANAVLMHRILAVQFGPNWRHVRQQTGTDEHLRRRRPRP